MIGNVPAATDHRANPVCGTTPSNYIPDNAGHDITISCETTPLVGRYLVITRTDLTKVRADYFWEIAEVNAVGMKRKKCCLLKCVKYRRRICELQGTFSI